MSVRPGILFSVAVSPDALLDYNTPRDKVTHDVAVRAVLDHGILTFGPGDAAALEAAIGDLVGRPSKSWSVALESLRSFRRVDESSLRTSIQTFIADKITENGSASSVALAVAPDAGVPTTPSGRRDPSRTELAALLDVGHADTLKASKTVQSFRAGSSREDVGDRVLRPIASRSTEVTVFDPFLFHDVVGTNSAPVPRDHIEWLSKLFAETLPESATLRLIGNYPSTRAGFVPSNAEVRAKIENAVRESIKARTTAMSVEVIIYKGSKREVESSNRFLFFSSGFEFEVSHDVLRLGQPIFPAPDAFSLHRLDLQKSAEAWKTVTGYLDYFPKGLLRWTISDLRASPPL